MNTQIRHMAESLQEEAVAIRRKLHRCAELSYCEYQTAAFVAEYLKEIGLSVETGVAKTGVTAFLDAGKTETILVRADMDALPMEELSDADYRSENKGVMHACGHDAHMAVVLCTAKLLSQIKTSLSANVLFVFQPAEETEGGAEPMIQTGMLETYHVASALGLHVMNDVPVGKILLKKGPLMASPDDFDLTICGRGGHGAYPHKCIDPISLSAKVIAAFESLCSRTLSPFAQKVISVCMVQGGATYNIIPDAVTMRGTVRTYDEAIRNDIPKQMEAIIDGICKPYGATFDFQFNFRYPPLINDDKAVDHMEQAVRAVLGEDRIVIGTEPSMAGDDFAYFAKAVPSVYFYLGGGNEKRGITMPLHSSDFEIDEDCLKVGIAAMASYVVHWN